MTEAAREGFPAGWYADGAGALRWWDGTRWLDDRMIAPPDGQPMRTDFSAFDLRLALLRPTGTSGRRR